MASDEMFSIPKRNPKKMKIMILVLNRFIASTFYCLPSDSSSIHRKCNKRTNKLLITNEHQQKQQQRKRKHIFLLFPSCCAVLCLYRMNGKPKLVCVGMQASCLKSSSFFTLLKYSSALTLFLCTFHQRSFTFILYTHQMCFSLFRIGSAVLTA